MGQALYAAQRGETDPAAKPLKGFGGAHVMEIVDRYDTNTYRAVYTVQFADVIYGLHAFRRPPTARHSSERTFDLDLRQRPFNPTIPIETLLNGVFVAFRGEKAPGNARDMNVWEQR